MTIEEEISRLPLLTNVGLALVEYVRAIHPGDFSLETRTWVYRPDNFVTFDIHWQRAKNITLSLRGSPSEFERYDVLPLTTGMGYVYARCKIEHPKQLGAASYYIRRALELFGRGRSRSHKTQKRVEQ